MAINALMENTLPVQTVIANARAYGLGDGSKSSPHIKMHLPVSPKNPNVIFPILASKSVYLRLSSQTLPHQISKTHQKGLHLIFFVSLTWEQASSP